jgi:hypothetical protein
MVIRTGKQMRKIVPIVEGDGEVHALPKLLSRLLIDLNSWDLLPARPRNAHGRTNLTRPGGIEAFLRIAEREPDCAGTLVLIDADEDCALHLGKTLARRCREAKPQFPSVVICAKCEYEAWFLASIQSIVSARQHDMPEDLTFEGDAEAVRNAKAWLSKQMPPGRMYKETSDQASMSTLLDFALARNRSRSFRRLCHAVEELVGAIQSNRIIVTPAE